MKLSAVNFNSTLKCSQCADIDKDSAYNLATHAVQEDSAAAAVEADPQRRFRQGVSEHSC